MIFKSIVISIATGLLAYMAFVTIPSVYGQLVAKSVEQANPAPTPSIQRQVEQAMEKFAVDNGVRIVERGNLTMKTMHYQDWYCMKARIQRQWMGTTVLQVVGFVCSFDADYVNWLPEPIFDKFWADDQSVLPKKADLSIQPTS